MKTFKELDDCAKKGAIKCFYLLISYGHSEETVISYLEKAGAIFNNIGGFNAKDFKFNF